MSIKSEWDFINKIKDKISSENILSDNLIVGIGDDSAVFKIDNNRSGLITTDTSIENIHFNIDISNPEDIGYKAMMGNISDIAAMGGKPEFAFISIGIPDDINENYILSIYDGILEAVKKTKCTIAGGDTSRSEKLTLCITIHGEVKSNRQIERKGTKNGDSIYITGTTGDSLAGFKILTENITEKKNYPNLIKKHTRPDCRIDMVDFIRKTYKPTSMIDISDGILSDLRHIADSSNAGFQLEQKNIPMSDELVNFSKKFGYNQYDIALKSGEEYELLFTSTKEQNIFFNEVPITKIGKIISDGFFMTINNQTEKIAISGYEHFKTGDYDV